LVIFCILCCYLYEELGDFDQALACLREAIRIDPEHAGARAQIAIMLKARLPEEDLAELCRQLAKPDLRDGPRSTLHFGLAQVLDARGAFDEVGEHLRQGNALRRLVLKKRNQDYNPDEHHLFVDNLIAAFTPEFFARFRDLDLETERPVFIIGLPRSGTTLTEQILASHSQVFGAGELRIARDSFESIPRVVDWKDTPFACFPRLDSDSFRQVAAQHLEKLNRLNASALRVVDKMPDNYLYLGLIAVLFPRAKLIHCRRDLRDTALSCWMTNFSQLMWAFDADHIASRFQEYLRVMEHWRRVLPVSVLEVAYEDLVGDREGVSRRLVAWCGLEWEPSCLEFHRNQRPVRTASLAQVRQPIYNTSVGRWKRYEKILGSLFAKL
jgi:tetratricopeptide (TPR) repeat protein